MTIHILVVDDDRLTRTILSSYFSKPQYQVDLAVDGKDALQKIIDSNNTTEQYDLVITDIEMPNMNGIELMNEMNRMDLMLPVMAITAATDDKNIIINLLRQGCSEYVPKPIKKEDLLQRTQKILSQKALKSSKKELEIHKEIDQIFIQHPTEKIDLQIQRFLTVLLSFMKSDFAAYGSVDSQNHNISLQTASSSNFSTALHKTLGSYTLKKLGKKCLETSSILINNNIKSPAEAFMHPVRFAAVPMYLQSYNAFFIVASSHRHAAYSHEDSIILKSIANHIAPILEIKSQMDESESQRRIVQDHLEYSNKELMKLNEELQLGQQLAESIFSNILADMPAASNNIDLYMKPMEKVGGDIFLSTPVFHNRQYMILGDFTGHGLAAAIGAVPVLNIFSKIRDNSHSISDIAREINRELKKLLPTGLFLCAGLLEIDYDADILHVWLGGLPDLLVFDSNGNLKHRVNSRHIPMAIIGDEAFDGTLDIIDIKTGDSFYIFSDGIIESQNDDEEMFGQERVEKILGRTIAASNENHHKSSSDTNPNNEETDKTDGKVNCMVNNIAPLISTFNDFCGKTPPGDDITIAGICYLPERIIKQKNKRITEWKLSWEIGVELLKQSSSIYTELLSLCIEPYPALHARKEELFLVLVELFTNAFEHGVLALDATLKKDIATMGQYFIKREEAIANLESGWINIEIELIKYDEKRELIINITDCGSGFDYKNECCLALSDLDDVTPSGRGLPLLKSICDDITFMGRGNKVRAVYSWDND
ncbi:putative cheY-like protein [Desulfamplus magnetovallimortis]|uniref:Putative cheY-like protein n=1 Tax=Desulfamplus magnetovallimortis TaxID=1246637 RepID=L0R3Z6_9BACT|nr:SpoIIE family protein phosphatase [Desulfamplus magnetovallimortis]CCO06738.1 putative cheY-like protein [Desulfamplus magnetovallimortis BW-1]SLM32789.1 putative cheY-like protein [Desulfamplus magnetovallimortis]